MTTNVSTVTHTHTYVATNLMRSVKNLIEEAGLNPRHFADSWDIWEKAISHWIAQQGLKKLILEVYDLSDSYDDRRGRFDFTINYSYGGDGELWFDPEIIEFAVSKSGSLPSACCYRLVATLTPFASDPPSGHWTSATLRSTDGYQRHTVGHAVAAGSTAAGLSYYRRVN